MQKDERDLLDVLKFELEFLEKGGYGRSPRQPWRCQFIFEDSPTCMNYDAKDHPHPCSECVLIQLVPPLSRSERFPCRQIPLNADGETLDSLYRYAEQHEIEAAVKPWLHAVIARLEQQRRALQNSSPKPPAASGSETKGEPLFHKLHPKCANPACATAFHWLEGGRFFRFRPDATAAIPEEQKSENACGAHGVKHYWLCEPCSHAFTLVYDQSHGVVLKQRWPELPEALLNALQLEATSVSGQAQ